jgi:hypothetical protein
MEPDKIAKNLLQRNVCAGCLHFWANHLFNEASNNSAHEWCEYHVVRPEEDTCENWQWSIVATFPRGREHG